MFAFLRRAERRKPLDIFPIDGLPVPSEEVIGTPQDGCSRYRCCKDLYSNYTVEPILHFREGKCYQEDRPSCNPSQYLILIDEQGVSHYITSKPDGWRVNFRKTN